MLLSLLIRRPPSSTSQLIMMLLLLSLLLLFLLDYMLNFLCLRKIPFISTWARKTFRFVYVRLLECFFLSRRFFSSSRNETLEWDWLRFWMSNRLNSNFKLNIAVVVALPCSTHTFCVFILSWCDLILFYFYFALRHSSPFYLRECQIWYVKRKDSSLIFIGNRLKIHIGMAFNPFILLDSTAAFFLRRKFRFHYI